MHIYRDATSVVCYCTGTVFLQNYLDQAAVTGKMFIYCIIYDFIDQMIQTFSGYTSYIHTRTLSYSLQPFQYRYTSGIIGFLFCHRYSFPFLSYTPKGVCFAKKK